MLKHLLDTRVLKKFVTYLASAFGIFATFFLVSYGGLWISFYFFDSPVPYIATLLGGGTLIGMYVMAKEKVEYERLKEQRELDYIAERLIAQEKHDKWREEFLQKYGTYP